MYMTCTRKEIEYLARYETHVNFVNVGYPRKRVGLGKTAYIKNGHGDILYESSPIIHTTWLITLYANVLFSTRGDGGFHGGHFSCEKRCMD
jgi:hypothetical protein